MKDFKPTGFGPKAGFHFPTKMGFTGSTGRMTTVAPYVRRKAFADGGYVSKTVGDTGSALVRRARPATAEDQESGGKTPLRPGFKKGGPPKKMRKADGGAVRGALDAAGGAGLSDRDRRYLNEAMRRAMPKKPTMPATGMKGKFAAADGGRIEKPTYMGALKDRVKEILGLAAENNTGMAKKAADKISGRQKQIDDIVDSAQTGNKASNYARGGKMKRMGYADGGGVSRGEAKKIAESTVAEHVRYPAPKGHRGLGKMMGKRT